jgi:NAD(P)-dependent dehydrogenase (short-subunit alcohol dehydrogenase family)
MKHAIPQMVKQGGGVILNTSSAQAIVGVPNLSPYAATKGGIISLTKTAAIEYASKNIRVNCIAPGMVKTPMLMGMADDLPPDSVEAKAMTEMAQQLIPLGRIAEPEEIANVMLFLASGESSYVTGAVFVADGGYSAQ